MRLLVVPFLLFSVLNCATTPAFAPVGDFSSACAKAHNGDACGCLADPNCGFCGYVVAGTTNTIQANSVCSAGTSTGPTIVGLCAAGGVAANVSNSQWYYGAQMAQSCKAGKAAAIAVPVAIAGAVFIFLLFWWIVRGRFWWRSTSHKRGFCHPKACCNGCLCCHPYEANPPPHNDDPESRKGKAVRVAPCWPHNCCATCKGGDPQTDEELAAHPCGLGCAPNCNWLPGCCCFRFPHMCERIWCEDEMPRVPGELEMKAKAVIKKVGGFCGIGGKRVEQPAPQQQQQQQGQGHGHGGSFVFGMGGRGQQQPTQQHPPHANRSMEASASDSNSDDSNPRGKKNPYPAVRK